MSMDIPTTFRNIKSMGISTTFINIMSMNISKLFCRTIWLSSVVDFFDRASWWNSAFQSPWSTYGPAQLFCQPTRLSQAHGLKSFMSKIGNLPSTTDMSSSWWRWGNTTIWQMLNFWVIYQMNAWMEVKSILTVYELFMLSKANSSVIPVTTYLIFS